MLADTPHPIDYVLASALRGEEPSWPAKWQSSNVLSQLLDRVHYHGIPALLLPTPASWPAELRATLRKWAKVQAHWELRHRVLIEQITSDLATRGARSLLLKGTALAYFVYDQPFERGRGDSDLMVHPDNVGPARSTLATLGFECPNPSQLQDGTELQESWLLESNGSLHVIDLHWAAFNSAFLAAILPVDECFANTLPLRRLTPDAHMLAPAYLLLHVCIHRAMHRTAPIFSRGGVHFGGNRLIWAVDIAKLAERFTNRNWNEFVTLAIAKGVSRAVLDALDFAARFLEFEVPVNVRMRLTQSAASQKRSDYLIKGGRRSRMFADFHAVEGWRSKAHYVRSRLSPQDSSLRDRYPQWAQAPRLLLLVRRAVDFLFVSFKR